MFFNMERKWKETTRNDRSHFGKHNIKANIITKNVYIKKKGLTAFIRIFSLPDQHLHVFCPCNKNGWFQSNFCLVKM